MASFEGEEQEDIKSMQLYCNIDRIWNELQELGYEKNQEKSIPVEVINQFDCYDYSGGKDLISTFPALDSSSYVLDIGSGLGGPARYLSSSTGCNVVGVELQEDVAALGNDLSAICDMKSRVHIAAGDFTDASIALHPGPSEDNTYDAVSYAEQHWGRNIVVVKLLCYSLLMTPTCDVPVPPEQAFSILVILHVPMAARVSLFRRCFDLLKPGGKLYIEDFFHRAGGKEFTDAEIDLLQNEVSIPDGFLPTREEYISQVESIGFCDVDFQDASAEWTAFTAERLGVWRENKERHERVHNSATFESLDRFYAAVVALFQGGTMGGVKLTLTKKLS
jgi:cyclopropane fatty-acyl-phospholipid synthase-like methyltransferase